MKKSVYNEYGLPCEHMLLILILKKHHQLQKMIYLTSIFLDHKIKLKEMKKKLR